ncbi:MAG: PASTA domain-containing protein [Spirochaetia bacterium]
MFKKETVLNSQPFKDEENHQSSFKVAVWSSLLSLFIMLLVTALVFFMTVAPKDEIMMPKVIGMHITDAMLLLQENDLYANIEMRFTENTDDAGFILEQKPASNSWVKGQRMVNLIVSRGMIVSLVPDFRGQSLDDVRQTLLTTFGDNLLYIKEPIIYAFDENPSGTVISQRPDPQMELTRNTPLELVVSRGANMLDGNVSKNYIGDGYEKALSELAKINTPFNFVILDQFDRFPKIIDQNPKPGSVLVEKQRMTLSISRPSPETLGNNVFGVYSYDVPVSDTPQTIEASLIKPGAEGDPQILFVTSQAGVNLAIPYLAPSGSDLVIKINNNESLRYPIR